MRSKGTNPGLDSGLKGKRIPFQKGTNVPFEPGGKGQAGSEDPRRRTSLRFQGMEDRTIEKTRGRTSPPIAPVPFERGSGTRSRRGIPSHSTNKSSSARVGWIFRGGEGIGTTEDLFSDNFWDKTFVSCPSHRDPFVRIDALFDTSTRRYRSCPWDAVVG